ncbi:MAG: helix-turn-helix transcriptional regulator [Eggerthellaceae bacterium]|nr:helix-turn-helix transcriptional regulator [Eggerthellaceae bacterium]
MDLQKTGDYIAGKRRALGLTQAQLAELLGMSDKSVSKWERGVSLPDVRVYSRLCEILGITVNEFIAGEDIPVEALPTKADANLVEVSTAASDKRRRLIGVLAAVAALAAVIALALVLVLAGQAQPVAPHVEPLERTSPEVQTASLVTGPEGLCLFKIFTDESFSQMTLRIDTYLAGVPTGVPREFAFPVHPSSEEKLSGMLALVPYTDRAVLHLAFDDGGSVAYSTDIDLPEGAALGAPDTLARGTLGPEDAFAIRPGETYPLLGVSFNDDDQAFATLYPEDSDSLRETDVFYLVSVSFR